VTDLKADNDEAYKRINTAVDLDAIKEKAINELGMFYATQDCIRFGNFNIGFFGLLFAILPPELFFV